MLMTQYYIPNELTDDEFDIWNFSKDGHYCNNNLIEW